MYSHDSSLAHRVQADLLGKPGLELFFGSEEQRGTTFHAAGFAEVWAGLHGILVAPPDLLHRFP